MDEINAGLIGKEDFQSLVGVERVNYSMKRSERLGKKIDDADRLGKQLNAPHGETRFNVRSTIGIQRWLIAVEGAAEAGTQMVDGPARQAATIGTLSRGARLPPQHHRALPGLNISKDARKDDAKQGSRQRNFPESLYH